MLYSFSKFNNWNIKAILFNYKKMTTILVTSLNHIICVI